MSPDKLAYMANQIGKFFAAQDPGAASAKIAEHLSRYWDPRMRRAIFAQLDAGVLQMLQLELCIVGGDVESVEQAQHVVAGTGDVDHIDLVVGDELAHPLHSSSRERPPARVP